MSEATIMSVVIDEMKKAQRSIVTGGEDKKTYVMKKIKDNMDDDTYERYEPILIVIVDIIKQIATDKQLLDGLHNSKCFKSILKNNKYNVYVSSDD